MSGISVVGFCGNLTRPSKTKVLVEDVVRLLSGSDKATFDIEDLGPSFPNARRLDDLAPQARHIVERLTAADILVAGSPTFKGSYTGLFKHLFDLIEPSALRGKPTIILATGGGERHSLMVEHQLRPLFGFFEALTLPTAVYVSDRDYADGLLVSEAAHARVRQAVAEAHRIVGYRGDLTLAA